jgi:hypothetical protein
MDRGITCQYLRLSNTILSCSFRLLCYSQVLPTGDPFPPTRELLIARFTNVDPQIAAVGGPANSLTQTEDNPQTQTEDNHGSLRRTLSRTMPGFFRARLLRRAERKSQAAQAAQEALAREKQQIQQVLAGIPKEMMDSKDMVIILNARGTVLLNMAFRGHPNQKSIVALASLAKTL